MRCAALKFQSLQSEQTYIDQAGVSTALRHQIFISSHTRRVLHLSKLPSTTERKHDRAPSAIQSGSNSLAKALQFHGVV